MVKSGVRRFPYPVALANLGRIEQIVGRQRRGRVSKVWLLIVEEGFAPSSYFVISNAVKEEIYKSKFDRLFLFRNFSREVIVLNVEP